MTEHLATIDNLTSAERHILIHSLADSHPVITKRLLREIETHRECKAVRAAMPPHPFLPSAVPESRLCYWTVDDVWCFQLPGHEIHNDEDPRAWQG